MGLNWALALPQGNLGEQVNQAFAQGQQNYEQQAAKNALGTLVQNPNDPQALAALAKVSPTTAMQYRQQQAELVRQQLAQHQDNILKGAEILRQFQPKDQASYTAALSAAQAAGVDLTGVPQEYNPQYVDGVVKLADALKPQQNPVQDPGIIREYDIATQRGLVPQGTTYEQYVAMRSPGLSTPVTVPYGATVTTPGQAGGLAPGAVVRGYRFKGGNPNDPSSWEQAGGAGGNASGGFPQ